MRLPAVLLACTMALPAQAGVIYNWEQVEPDATFGNFTSFIGFSSSAWSPGGSIAVEGNGEVTPISHRESKIDNVFADFDATEGRLVDWAYEPCSAEPGLCALYGIDPSDEIIQHPLWSFNVLGVFDGDFLVGFDGPSSLPHIIAFNDQVHSYVMTFQPDGLWHFEDIGSDETNRSCPFQAPCTATGRWVLDASTVPVSVPEPLPLAVMGSGLLMLWLRFRPTAPASFPAR